MIESQEQTYHQINKDVILKRAKDYYESDKKNYYQAKDKYRNLSEEEKLKERIWKKEIP